MSFPPYPTQSKYILLGLTLVLAAVIVYLFDQLIRGGLVAAFGPLVWLLIVLVIFGIALYGSIIAFNLRYFINRNGVIIRWGLEQHFIPVDTIKTILPGDRLPAPPSFEGINIGGLRLGRGKVAEYGSLRFHTTATTPESLIIVTTDQPSFVISPQNPHQFIKAWQDRRPLGPTQKWLPEIKRVWPLNTPLFTEALARRMVSIGLLLSLVLLSYLLFVYPDLPRLMSLRITALETSRTINKAGLIFIPLAGIGIVVFNAVLGNLIYKSEKVAAYLLWGSTIFTQLCLWISLLFLTR
ncbi:MAG: PH domain-containing protein [Anaerolineae bacterium]|nr:PH domain-containing protein [Anaerolineae bacterium]